MKSSIPRSFCFTLFLLAVLVTFQGVAQESAEAHRINTLETRVLNLENRTHMHQAGATAGGIGILFGAFCALWAQNTGRNPWTWFFLGLLFSVITVLVLLSKNAEDKKGKL